jgi:cytoskeletal protein CcmA (bactofilin family)
MFSKKISPVNKIDDEGIDESRNVGQADEGNAVGSASEAKSANGVGLSNIAKPTIISEGFEFEGIITSSGTINISGVVRGKLSAKSVLVDTTGHIEGELSSDQLMVKGSVSGEIVCKDLNVGSRAMVSGKVSYQNIHIQRGGKVSGSFNKN